MQNFHPTGIIPRVQVSQKNSPSQSKPSTSLFTINHHAYISAPPAHPKTPADTSTECLQAVEVTSVPASTAVHSELTVPENLPTVSENLPTVSENLLTVSENLPTVSENLPTVKEEPMCEEFEYCQFHKASGHSDTQGAELNVKEEPIHSYPTETQGLFQFR